MSDLEKFLKSVADLFVEIFSVTNVSFTLVDEEAGSWGLKVSSQLKEEKIKNVSILTTNGTIMWLNNPEQMLHRLEFENGEQLGLYQKLINELQIPNSHICIPMVANGRLIGILSMGCKTDGRAFGPEDLRLLSILTEYLSALLDYSYTHKVILNQKEYHKNILENMASGIIAINLREIVTIFNRSAEDILGFKAEQVIGKHIQMVQGNLANLILDTLHYGKSYRRKEIHILPENILLGVSTSQLYDNNGKVNGAAMVFTNLSNIKYAEVKTHKNNENILWERLSISLSHEIKNSLTPIKSFVQLLPNRYNDTDFREKFYDIVLYNIERLDNFTERINRFAQISKPKLKDGNIHKIIDDVLSFIIEKQNPQNITFIKRYTNSIPNIKFDHSQLREVFYNLIINGIESMPDGGTFSISTEIENRNSGYRYNSKILNSKLLPANNKYVVINFTDTGIGISDEDITKIFNPFFTIKKGRPNLGLAIASRIIEEHNGFIDVKSELNEGSTFSVYLPLD